MSCPSDLTSKIERLQQSYRDHEQALRELQRQEEELKARPRKENGAQSGDLDDTLVNENDEDRASLVKRYTENVNDTRHGDEIVLEDLEPAGVTAEKVCSGTVYTTENFNFWRKSKLYRIKSRFYYSYYYFLLFFMRYINLSTDEQKLLGVVCYL